MEIELFMKEYENYLFFILLNKTLKRYNYTNIKDKYNNEDIEDIIWFFYQTKYVATKEFIKIIQWPFYKENNGYIVIDKHKYPYWFYIFIIKKLLENQDYIYLKDLYFYNFWVEINDEDEIRTELNNEGIYLYDIRVDDVPPEKVGKDKDFLILTNENQDEYTKLDSNNPEDKEKINNSLFYKIPKYIHLNNDLSCIYFLHIIQNICNRLSNKYLEGVSAGTNIAMAQHVHKTNMCEFRKIIKNIVENEFENLKKTVPFSYYKDIKIFVPNYEKIILLYKRYIVIMRAEVTFPRDRHTRHIINDFKFVTGFIGEKDYYKLREEDNSYEVDLGGLLPRGNNKSPVSVTNRAVVGGVLGGSTGAMLGAISAQERNSQIEKNKNTRYELKQKIKNSEVWVTLLYSNRSRREHITFDELVAGKNYAKEFIEALDYALSLPIEFDNDKDRLLEECKIKKKTINSQIKNLNKELEEVNNIIENNDSFFGFGKKYQQFKTAIERKETLEKDLPAYQDLNDKICETLDLIKKYL